MHQQQRSACEPGATLVRAFVVGIPKGGCKAHSDKKCLVKKFGITLMGVVASEGDN